VDPIVKGGNGWVMHAVHRERAETLGKKVEAAAAKASTLGRGLEQINKGERPVQMLLVLGVGA